MRCWKCGQDTGESAGVPLSFRATCSFCGIDIHCCKQCKFYQPGKPNDCLIPGTEFVKDREKANFCEDYKGIAEPRIEKKSSKSEIEKRLFGE